MIDKKMILILGAFGSCLIGGVAKSLHFLYTRQTSRITPVHGVREQSCRRPHTSIICLVYDRPPIERVGFEAGAEIRRNPIDRDPSGSGRRRGKGKRRIRFTP